MRVLFTAQSYYPIVCGISGVVTNLAEGLARKGHNVQVATEFCSERTATCHNGVEILQFKVKGNPALGYNGEIKKYQNFVLDYDGDVIINECAQCWGTDVLLSYLHNIRPLKILHSHGLPSLVLKARNPMIRWKFYRYYHKFHTYLKEYDHLLYISGELEEKPYSNKHGITHWSILENGVEDEIFSKVSRTNIRTKYRILPDTKILLCVANFGKMKNQKFVIDSFYRMQTKEKVILCMVGSQKTDYFNELQEYKKACDSKYGIKDVLFMVGIDRSDTLDLYRQASLFLYGSCREAFPLVLIECMASKTPFISTNVGNAASLPGGCIANTPTQMAQMADHLLENHEAHRVLAEKGYDTAFRTLRWPLIVEKLEDRLLSLFQKRKGA